MTSNFFNLNTDENTNKGKKEKKRLDGEISLGYTHNGVQEDPSFLPVIPE